MTRATRFGLSRSGAAAIAASALLVAPLTAPTRAATRQFRGVNWADRRDNFVPDDLVLAGLDASDTYDVTRVKTEHILRGFERDLRANTIRLPVNYPTVSGSYWRAYAGVIDEASHLGFNTVLSYWESSDSKDGKVDDLDQFWMMWQAIVDKYRGDDHVYFEPMNEPHGYRASEWDDLAAEWLRRFPTVPRGQVILSGVGYNQDGVAVGRDPRLAGCLISIHIYGFWHRQWTTEQAWTDALTASVGAFADRTLISEFGAPMTTGLDYDGEASGPNGFFIAFMKGVSNRARALALGTIYWPGLRVDDPYSLETVHGSGTSLSLTLNNLSGRDLLMHSWGR